MRKTGDAGAVKHLIARLESLNRSHIFILSNFIQALKLTIIVSSYDFVRGNHVPIASRTFREIFHHVFDGGQTAADRLYVDVAIVF